MQNKAAGQTAGATAEGTEEQKEGAADKKDDPNAADADALAAAGLLSKEEKEKQAAEMREVMRVAQSLERAEEEEMIKRALAESERIKSEEQKALDEEEEMLKRVMEESAREEAERQNRLKGQEADESSANKSAENASMSEELLRQKQQLEEKER